MSTNRLESHQLDQLLQDKQEFNLKGKLSGWLIFFIVILITSSIVFFVLGSLFSDVDTDYVGKILLVVATLFLVVFLPLIGIMIYLKLSKTLVLSPEGIAVKRGDSFKFNYRYDEIYTIEYYIHTLVINNVPSRENMVKLILKTGKTKKITADYWRTPRPLPTDIYIRTILSHYFQNGGIDVSLQDSAPIAAPAAPPTSTSKPSNFCSNCGNKLNRGEKFCTNCGIKLVS